MSNTIGRRAFLSTAAIGMAGTLAGCLSLGGTPPVTYDLRPTVPQGVSRRSNRMVAIDTPEAIATYDSERIVVREAGGILSYLSESQWSDRLPVLVQTRMLQSFRDAGVSNIGRPRDPVVIDVILSTDIRAFELDTATGVPLARVALSVRLVDDRNRALMASRTFSADTQAASTNPVAVVAALNAALDTVLGEVVVWTAARA